MVARPHPIFISAGEHMPKRRGRGEGSIELLPSGNYRAVVSRTVNGSRVRSSKTFESKADALRWRDAHRDGVPAAAGTLGEWLTTWLPLHEARVAASTYRTDRHTAGRHVLPHLGAVRLRDLTPLAVASWLCALRAAGVGQTERHKAGKVLRKVLNAAVAAGQLPVSPMAGGRVKVPRRPEPQTDALDAADLRRLVVAADALGHGAMFRLWADAGLRPAELVGLKWGDFDAAEGTLAVRRAVCKVTGQLKELKTRRSKRVLPIGAATAAALAGLRPAGASPDSPMFPTPSGLHWWPNNHYHKVFLPVAAAAGVRATPYTLRHTMATLLLRERINPKTVSERLGHEDISTTLRSYAHALPGDQQAAARLMGEIIDGATRTAGTWLEPPDSPRQAPKTN